MPLPRVLGRIVNSSVRIQSVGFGNMPKEISSDVFLVDTLAAGIPGLVASYLIKGEKSALVDAGYPTSANTLLSELRALDASWRQVDFLIPTHVHLDHAGGVGHLARAMPKARILVNEHGAKHLIDPAKLIQSAVGLFGKEAMSLFGTPIPVPTDRVEMVSDVCDLDLGAGVGLRIFWTPGHAWHHMSVLIESERLLVTGDAVGLRYQGFDIPIPATPPPGFNEEQYVKTLTGFTGMNLAGLLLPHFGLIREDLRGFLEKNLETIKQCGSRAFDAVNFGEPVDRLFDWFMTDIANRAGKSLDEIPDHITRNIMFSAMGCYSHAQEVRTKQRSLET